MREVASICKDKDGFIWASSKTGIIRLSEDNYHIYQLPYKTADVIYVKLVHDNGILLAFTNNGQLFSYNVLTDKFDIVIDLRNHLRDSHVMVRNILIDPTGSFLIATSMGLYKYSHGNISRLGGGYFSDVHQIAWHSTDHMFVAGNRGVWLINTLTMDGECLYENDESHIPIQASSLYYDIEADRLWVGTTSDGLFCHDLKNEVFSRVLFDQFPKQPIQAITGSSDSTILIGIDGQGLWEITKAGEKVLNVYKENSDNPLSLKGDGVYDIFFDSNQRVWVCTYSGGLSYFDRESTAISQIVHQINNQNSLNNNNVNKVIEDSKGNLWFATNNGVSRWNVTSGKWTTYFANKHEQAQVFLSLCEDDRGNIWAGTYSSGVYIIDGETGRETMHYSKEEMRSSLTNNFIFDIFKDSDGDLWLGGPLGDTFCYIQEEKEFKQFPYHPVYAFAELNPGQILLACTNGLSLLDKQTAKTAVLLDGYLLHDILVLEQEIWLATAGDGLLKYNPNDKTVRKFTTETSLPSNYINSIIYAEGYLWLGTENGLCRFDPEDETVFIYSSISPFFNVSFNQNASYQLRNGQLTWGTNNGAVIFDPNVIQLSKPAGRIFFQDLVISGRSIRETSSLKLETPLDDLDNISLDYDQNTVALEVLAIGTAIGNSKFSWKMEGIDDEWSQPTTSHVLTYASLPSGKFQLKIRMYDSSLSQLVDERVLNIQVTPPFWETWWYRLIIFIFVAGVIALALRFYIGRLKDRHTKDKIRFFTNTAHDIRTSLTLISAPIEELNKEKELSEEGRYFLNLATEQSGRLSFVATQLLDFQKVDVGKGQLFLAMTDIVNLVSLRRSIFVAAAKKQKVELLFSSNRESYLTALDELKIEKVVDNLISNAIKYSKPGSKVEINLECDANRWSLEVKDHGLGISDRAKSKLFREFYRGDNVVNSKIVGSGIGLLLVKNYVSMHDGVVSLESKENIGSSFKIVIPYKRVSDMHPPVTAVIPTLSLEASGSPDEVDIPDKKEETEGRKERILIVEDNNDLQTFLKHAFQRDYHVTVASDGAEAWEEIQKRLPELVISDIMMPNMDGFELCRLIKSTFDTSHIPVVLLTALTERAQQLQGLGLGADDYLTKPFDMALLAQRIQTIINNRRAVRERALKLIQETGEEPVLLNELNDAFVKKAVEVVRTNMDNTDFNKDTFAFEMNVSSSLLYKKLKSLTDQSPVDFIRGIRLNYAVELLQTGRYTVTEVSELCGFTSAKYFSQAFKNYFGKAPSRI